MSLFKELWKNHPKDTTFYPGYPHSCSIDMSASLQLSGIDMSRYTGTFFPYKYNGKKLILARDINILGRWIQNNIKKIIPSKYYLGLTTQTNKNWSRTKLYEFYPHLSPKGDYIAPNNDVYPPEGEAAYKNKFMGKRGIIILWECWLNRDSEYVMYKGRKLPTTKSIVRGHIDLWDNGEMARATYNRSPDESDAGLLYTSSKVDLFEIA